MTPAFFVAKAAGVDVSHGVEQDTIIFKDAMRTVKFIQDAREASHGSIEELVFQDIVEESPAALNETEQAANVTEPATSDGEQTGTMLSADPQSVKAEAAPVPATEPVAPVAPANETHSVSAAPATEEAPDAKSLKPESSAPAPETANAEISPAASTPEAAAPSTTTPEADASSSSALATGVKPEPDVASTTNEQPMPAVPAPAAEAESVAPVSDTQPTATEPERQGQPVTDSGSQPAAVNATA